ncbi:MAG: DUF1272 domain-containing protein [Gammaproteobacteria bacterium]|nr:DUF1272 domain-containing protein [Gammaproteobacteria bacterium]MDH5729232.1 DUF1272 domain-containing protein [Gammaproteobacteria bacterium]
MLELRPNCECCNKDLPPASNEAVICTFECTFCKTCATTILNNKCPNCGGNLVERPIRPENELQNHPASTKRVLKENGCRNIV